MNRVLKFLAIAVLLVTVAGAGVVLYGIHALAPKVVDVSLVVTPANQAKETFDAISAQWADGLFDGKMYSDILALDAQECAFVTYTVRLKNAGFFPAEWIALEVQPVSAQQGQDVLVMSSGGANVLAANTQGDLSVSLLTTIENPQPPRTILITCYVFGRKQTVQVAAQ